MSSGRVTSASNFQETPIPWSMRLRRRDAVQDMVTFRSVIEIQAHPDQGKHPYFVAVVDRKRFLQRVVHRQLDRPGLAHQALARGL